MDEALSSWGCPCKVSATVMLAKAKKPRTVVCVGCLSCAVTHPAAWLIAEPALLRAPPAALLAADLCACLLDRASCRAACRAHG
jgi:hypothetical protein